MTKTTALTTSEQFFMDHIELTCDTAINRTPEDDFLSLPSGDFLSRDGILVPFPEDYDEIEVIESLAAKGIIVIESYDACGDPFQMSVTC